MDTIVTTAAAPPPRKVIVAVHGIGDQTGYATAQMVVAQVGRYHDIQAAVPLGRFYQVPGQGVLAMRPPGDPECFDGLSFGEVYWADIARKIEREGHILEDTKGWANTVAGRLAARSREGAAKDNTRPMPRKECQRVVTALEELVDGVAALQGASFVLKKAGVEGLDIQQLDLADHGFRIASETCSDSACVVTQKVKAFRSGNIGRRKRAA